MKVSDLVGKLQAMDQNLEVLIVTDDALVTHPERGYRVLDITEASPANVSLGPSEEGGRLIAFGAGEATPNFAVLDATTDF